VSTKASSCSDIGLSRVLKKYDLHKTDVLHLEEVPTNSLFLLQGKCFKKGELRRKRYLCEDVQSKRMYLVHALAEVKLVEPT
jgi:hypothetical protein